MFPALLQSVLTLMGLVYAARIGWLGPRFERSLAGDSRLELLWLAGLFWIVATVFESGWPDIVRFSYSGVFSLFVTVILAMAYQQAYWWTDDLSPKAKRVMETTCHVPEARRMIRCWIWTTTAFLLAAQSSRSASVIAVGLALANCILWGKRSFHLLYLARRTRECGRTPWDKRGDQFDVFLSYRRLNANVVRRIAEGLALRGVRVWFDEYLIRVRDRSLIEQWLSEGIAAAQKLVVFSNDSYAKSPWCCSHELEPFVSRVGVQNVVPVGMPKEPEFLQKYGSLLANCSWKDFAGTELLDEEIEEAIAHICTSIGRESGDKPESLAASNIPAEPNNRVEVQAEKCTVSLDLAGFDFWHDVESNVPRNQDDGVSAFYKREHRGTFVCVEFSAGLTWGEKRSGVAAEQQLSDTQLMEQARDFASSWLEQAGHRDLGVHTVIAFGFRHFAMSYWQTAVGAWARKYSIVIPHPQTGENFEVVVTFTHHGTFADFLAFAPTMDGIIYSMKLR